MTRERRMQARTQRGGFSSRLGGLCCLAFVAAALAAGFAAPAARGQDATAERKDPPAAVPEAAPERRDPPAPDPAAERKDPPAAAQEAPPERKEPPAPDPAAERKDPPAAAQEAPPEPKDAPASAQETPPERKEPPAAAQDTPPARKDSPPQAKPAPPAPKPPPARAPNEPDRLRGVIATVEQSSLVLQLGPGKTVRLGLPANLAVFTLTKASFTEVDFGKYVGAVSRRLGDHIYSPIIRDSLSWLHRGFELRIIDEDLRGIAVGHAKWDLTPDSVITHGWVDDMEDRVISIKYGPTEEEETDVEVPRDIPVLRMSRGERTLIKPGMRIFAGAQKGADGNYVAVFIFVGKDGIVPPL
jgi:hypothetical protein